MGLPAVTLPKSFGPCMRALNERQRAYVMALLEVGGEKGYHTTAARMAGYSAESQKSLSVQAYRLAHDEKIQAAIKEVAMGTMSSEALGLVGVLLKIAYGELPANAAEKMKAINMVFNRTGMPETTQHFVKVEHNVNNDETISRLYQLAKVLNVDPKQVLGNYGLEVVEGEFREVGTNDPDVPQSADSSGDAGGVGDLADDPFAVD